jgi:hypothetical protein
MIATKKRSNTVGVGRPGDKKRYVGTFKIAIDTAESGGNGGVAGVGGTAINHRTGLPVVE